MIAKNIGDHIDVTTGTCGGKPRIAGHRITVQQIVVWHERMGRSVDEISTEYDLDLSDVYAALAYYFDHRAEVDRAINDSENWIDELRQAATSPLKQKLQRNPTDG